MFYTVYKITNIINNNIYIGIHKTEDLDDDYFGSGLIINRAIKKYGRENFIKEYIAIFDNVEDMINLEKTIVDESFLRRDDTYNLKIGGFGGWDFINENKLNLYYDNEGNKLNGHLNKSNLKTGAEIKEKMINDGVWEEYRKKLSKIMNDRYANGFKNGFLGKTHTIETRQKISKSHAENHPQKGEKNSQYGTICIFNEKLRENKRLGVGESIPEGWERGSVFNWGSRELRLAEEYQRELNRCAAEDKKIEHFKALWDKFINGKYSSIRDFARCEYDKSHVYLTKNWKKYIKDYENVKQGKSFNSN